MTSDTREKKQSIVTGRDMNNDPKPFLKWKFEFNEKTGRNEFKSLSLSDDSRLNEQSLIETMKRATGSSDVAVAEKILNQAAQGMTAECREERLNQSSALLPSLRPQDETEALLLGQFLALQDSGIKCLRLAHLPDQGFYHQERLLLLSNKLLSTANQTMQTVLKYRCRGQQTVQVLHVHNEGQAIVAQNLSHSGGGDKERN